MADKMAAAYQFALWTIYLNHLLPDYLQIHSKLSVCPLTKMAAQNNQDGRQNGRQNGRHLSVYTCGHSNLVIYHPISSKFHI